MKNKHHKRIAQNLEIVKRLQRKYDFSLYSEEDHLELMAFFNKYAFKK